MNILNHYSLMGLVVRDYSPQDLKGVIEVFRDSNETLRLSRGGRHPDSSIDRLVGIPDEKLGPMLTKEALVIVAELDGEIAGFTAFSFSLADRILRSAYGKSLYVKGRFQRGRAGVNLGKTLMRARSEKLRQMGFRKYYSYSVPESSEFQRKQGAKFYPLHDSYSLNKHLRMEYFEVEIRPTPLNAIRVEPFIFELKFLVGRIWGKTK